MLHKNKLLIGSIIIDKNVSKVKNFPSGINLHFADFYWSAEYGSFGKSKTTHIQMFSSIMIQLVKKQQHYAMEGFGLLYIHVGGQDRNLSEPT